MISVLALVCAQQAARADDGPTLAVMNDAASAVVQVIATSCDGGSRTGTGFFLANPTDVVTDLHVVAGCANVTVHLSGTGDVQAAMSRALTNADLALLHVPAQPSVHPLRASQSSPQINDTLQVIGYYFGVPTLDSRPLHVTLGKPVLQDMLTDDLRAAILKAGSPDLTTDIIRLDGNLVPGLSGAPVIDSTGQVVGIGSGGLENGTVGISWAVQAHYLSDLETAPAVSTASLASTSPLFAAPLQGADGKSVRCGDFSFVYIKTRSLQELLASADDVPGLYQIAATTGDSEAQLLGFEYDVYTEPQSGGSVAIPQGATLVPWNNICVAQLADGLAIALGSTTVHGIDEIQAASRSFETVFGGTGFLWQVDPSFTYTRPMVRSDGLIVRRRNYVGYSAPGMVRADAFETLMARGNTFIGVGIRNAEYIPTVYWQCYMQPGMNGCDQVNTFRQIWATAGLGIQLSTFPRN
jgi:hypothetical protein